MKGVIGRIRERFSTQVYEDSVRIPQESYQLPQAQAVPSRTMDGLKSNAELQMITNANGQKEWVVIYKV